MYDDLAIASGLLFSVLFVWVLVMAWIQSIARGALRG